MILKKLFNDIIKSNAPEGDHYELHATNGFHYVYKEKLVDKKPRQLECKTSLYFDKKEIYSDHSDIYPGKEKPSIQDSYYEKISLHPLFHAEKKSCLKFLEYFKNLKIKSLGFFIDNINHNLYYNFHVEIGKMTFQYYIYEDNDLLMFQVPPCIFFDSTMIHFLKEYFSSQHCSLYISPFGEKYKFNIYSNISNLDFNTTYNEDQKVANFKCKEKTIKIENITKEDFLHHATEQLFRDMVNLENNKFNSFLNNYNIDKKQPYNELKPIFEMVLL